MEPNRQSSLVSRSRPAVVRVISAGATAPVAGLISGAGMISLAPVIVALSEADPLATGAWRLTLAAGVLWTVAIARRGRAALQWPGARALQALLTAGAGFAGMLAFWHHGILYSSVANATLFQNMAPIFVAFAAWALWRTRLRKAFLAGLAIAIAGGAVLVRDSQQTGAGALGGDLLAVVSAAFYAGYILAVRQLRTTGIDSVDLMAWVCLIGAVLIWPVAALAEDQLAPTSLIGWQLLAVLAVVSQALGQGAIAGCLKQLSAPFCAVGLLLEPVFAAVLAWIVLAQALSPDQAGGGVLVMLGVAICERTRPERVPARPRTERRRARRSVPTAT